MIVDRHISEYLRSLEPDMPEYLAEAERQAQSEEIPIIRKDAQALLRFLLRQKRPERILEVGAAVGFSCMYMSEYMPAGARIVTLEKDLARARKAKENFAKSFRASHIALLIGDASDILEGMSGPQAWEEFSAKTARAEIYLPDRERSKWNKMDFCEPYDFIFMDAAKGQYMHYLPRLLRLLKRDGMLVTDNVLQEGSIADSKFAIARRERTIHMRMREYLHELTHRADLNTAILPVGDGISLTTFC